VVITYRKIRTRNRCLFRQQISRIAEYIVLPNICGDSVYFEPLFIYEKGAGCKVYYDFTSLDQVPTPMAEYFNKNKPYFFQLVREFEDLKAKLLSLSNDKNSLDFQGLFKDMLGFWGRICVFMMLSGSIRDTVDKEIADLSYKLRAENDRVIYIVVDRMKEILRNVVPSDIVDFIDFLLLEEIVSGKFPNKEELIKRSEHYVYFKGNVYSEFLSEELCSKLGIEVKGNQQKGLIKGSGVSDGCVKGRVKIVHDVDEMKDIEDGSIIVTSMTTPDFLPYLDKVGGVITDEGGVTCHAAIVAREFKFPCIVGTDIATLALRDGDVVEIDGGKGIVKRIS